MYDLKWGMTVTLEYDGGDQWPEFHYLVPLGMRFEMVEDGTHGEWVLEAFLLHKETTRVFPMRGIRGWQVEEYPTPAE